MDDLRLTLMVICALAIVGIFLHGHFSIRRSTGKQAMKQHAKKEPVTGGAPTAIDKKTPVIDESGFDQFGIGKKRVVEDAKPREYKPLLDSDDFEFEKPTVNKNVSQPVQTEQTVTIEKLQPEVTVGDENSSSSEPQKDAQIDQQKHEQTVSAFSASAEIKTVSNEVQKTHTESNQTAHQTKENSGLMGEVKSSLESIILPKRAPRKRRPRRDPRIADNQVDMFGESDNPDAQNPISSKSNAEPEEVIALNVMVAEGSEIRGEELLPAFLTLGLKFGDFNIFHRHQDNAGNGPVLFSVANMFKPGIFDVDKMENFSTRGISLFMTLPLEQGEPQQTFNMMHNAARKLAEEFGAQVLDGSRSVLTKQRVQHYSEQIREFERRKLLVR